MDFDQQMIESQNEMSRPGGEAPARMRPIAYPIAEAVAEPGHWWGPVLLWPGDEEGNWRLGRWTGQSWANDEDLIIHPAYFSLVPSTPAL